MANKPDAVLVRNARRCIQLLRKDNEARVTRRQNFIKLFGETPELRHFRELRGIDSQTLVDAAARVFVAMSRAHVTTFNPFILCGFDPSENQWSNALARLLDPREPHGFGIRLVRALINAVRPEAEASSQTERLANIVGALEASDPRQIIVQREYRFEGARPDIAIIRRNQFLIFIENKRRDGVETFIGSKPQTVRMREGVAEVAEKNGVPLDHTLSIYLHPSGNSPSDGSFLQLTSAGLVQAMLDELAEDTQCPESSRQLAQAFLRTYDWLN
jgi:hypothetical protein